MGKLGAMRFEDTITVICCKEPMLYAGNLSLREAGADATCVLFTCKVCNQRISVTEGTAMPPSSQRWGEVLAEIDTVE